MEKILLVQGSARLIPVNKYILYFGIIMPPHWSNLIVSSGLKADCKLIK